jgi:hypothetical protein
MRDPRTREEWQQAVDLADWYLHVHSARAYGLIETDMKIDVDRCDEILKRGAAAGVTPSMDAPEKLTAKCVHAARRERRSA